MPAPPTGTITFLFTDIEGSSSKWERTPEAMQRALQRHDTMLRGIFESSGGYVFKTMGDAFCVAFDTAALAVNAALQAQRALNGATWEGLGELKVRMALHTGAADQRDSDYFGQSLNRVSRILSAAHGGQTLLSLATEELVRDHLPEGAQLRFLGEHRLRDLARPENIYQLVAHDLPAKFAPLRSLESVPNNLPEQLSSFVGRERELAEVRERLGSARLVTLTGPGGTGKTRLSLQVAAEVLDGFTDGVWFVEFGTIADGTLVAETLASALDVRQEADRPLATTLTGYLRQKNLLLIFDNCEHVVAACAHLAESLLRSCPKLRILASSREALSIPGESTWPLAPLSLPDHWRDIAESPNALDQLQQYEAIRLFVERARVARPTFSLNNQNAPLVARICYRLDGIPLAIELAAARVKVLALDQIIERLDDRFRLLTTGSRTAAPRQQTLRSLIDWSYDLLSEPEQKLLRRLSVFGRGRSLDALEAVCSGDGVEENEVIDLITQLVDKSLVTVEKLPEIGARYFMLESLWDYSRGKLDEAGETAACRVRHLDYFLRFAEEAEPRILGRDQRAWLPRLDAERINLRFAVEASLEIPGQAQKGMRLLAAVQRFIEVHGLFAEARASLAQLLATADGAPRDPVRIRALEATSRLAWITDDFSFGRDQAAESLSIAEELGDIRAATQARNDLAMYLWNDGRLADAEALLAVAVSAADALGNLRLTATIRHTQAIMRASHGDHIGALQLDRESHSLFRALGDEWMATIVNWAIGVSATVLGDFAEARARISSCLQIGLDLGNRWGVPYPVEAFGMIALAEGHDERAARLFGAAEALRNRTGLVAEPPDHPAFRELIDAARDRLSTPRAQAAYAEGSKLTDDEIIALALS